MVVIEFRHLSMPETEDAIVALWNCFEEYNIPSQAMTFEFHSGAAASLQVHIEDAALAGVVTKFLSTWNVARRGGGATPIARRRSMQRPTTVSKTWRRRSLSRKRPWRSFHNVEWSCTSRSRPGRPNHR